MNRKQISRSLAAKGYYSIASWAREHGYESRNVQAVITRWSDRGDGFPRGKTAQILIELSRAVGAPVSPALVEMQEESEESAA